MTSCRECGFRIEHKSSFECRALVAARDAASTAVKNGKRYFDVADLRKALLNANGTCDA